MQAFRYFANVVSVVGTISDYQSENKTEIAAEADCTWYVQGHELMGPLE